MSATRSERHEFIGLIYENSVYEWKDGDPAMFRQKQAEKLMRYAATLHRLAEELCNGYQDWQGNWDEKRTIQSEKKRDRIQQKAQECVQAIGGKAICKGDPRGCVLLVVFPNGYTNDWGREGICVPC